MEIPASFKSYMLCVIKVLQKVTKMSVPLVNM